MRVLKEDKNKIAVLGWGRFNPPTIGHQLLGQVVKDTASKVGGTPMIYSSHTYRKKKDKNGLWGDPLPYEEKAKWLKKVFGDMFVESNLTILPLILKDIYDKGYNELYFIAGSDRIDEYRKLVDAYNGKPTKSGGILYDFDNLDDDHFIPAGNERDDNAEGIASVSGTGTRKLAYDGDLEGFKKAVPFNDKDAEAMYNDVRSGLGINEGYNMKVIKEADNTFDTKRNLSGANSIRDVYNILLTELKNTADQNTMEQVTSIVKSIENLTNSLDLSTITKLQNRLSECNSGLTVNNFINSFSPSSDDITLLLKDDGITVDNYIDLKSYGFTDTFINELIKYKGGNKRSSTAIGPYEFLIALLFKNGNMQTKTPFGDVSIGNYDVEVKGVNNYAVIGNDTGNNIEIIKEFDDFIFNNLENGAKTKTRKQLRNSDFNGTEIDISNTKYLKNIMNGRTKVSFKDLFDNTFKYILADYVTRFQLLALCKGYIIEFIPSDKVIEEIFTPGKYDIIFKDYMTGRYFKVKKR